MAKNRVCFKGTNLFEQIFGQNVLVLNLVGIHLVFLASLLQDNCFILFGFPSAAVQYVVTL